MRNLILGTFASTLGALAGVAEQIGGANVAVNSILTNPEQDPHEFEASTSTARLIADAQIVIYNGADYDPWAVKLLSASKSPSLRRKAQVRCSMQP